MSNHGFTDKKDIYDLQQLIDDVAALKRSIKETYPVGSIYMSVRNVNPSSFFGGTWVSWGQGRVPIGIGSNGTTNYSTPEGTGGSESVSIRPTGSISATALTIRQTPPHQHRIWGVNRNVNVQGGGSDPGYNALYTGNMHSVPGVCPYRLCSDPLRLPQVYEYHENSDTCPSCYRRSLLRSNRVS